MELTHVVKKTKKTKDECNICSEVYTCAIRKKVVCHCGFEACRVCCTHYIMDSINEAKCMQCKSFWNVDFMIENFTSKFYHNDYRNHQENLFFDREKSQFNGDYIMIETIKKADAIEEQMSVIDHKIEEVHEEYLRNIRILKDSRFSLNTKRDNYINGIDDADSVSAEESNRYFGPCPNVECRGVINSSWKCAICDQKVCKSCKVKLSNDKDAHKLHACDPNTLQTLELIKKECKKCPKCKVDIYKISGCNQMWCTNCAIAFCWRTGEVFKKNIHNPHYFEWMGGNRQVTGEGGCAGNQDRITRSLIYHKVIPHNGYSNFWKEFVYMYNDIRHNEIGMYNNMARIVDNQPIRIKYLRNFIDESAFKREIFLLNKNTNKASDIVQILESFITSMTACLFQFNLDEQSTMTAQRNNAQRNNAHRDTVYIYDMRKDSNFLRSLECMEEIINYTNKSLIDIIKKYKTNTLYITFNFIIKKNNEISWMYKADRIKSISDYTTRITEAPIKLKFLKLDEMLHIVNSV
jgi:hypothetical protein